MEKSTLLTALLIGLVILSGVQAIEIMSMKSDASPSQLSQGRVAINSNDDMSSHHGGGQPQQSQQSPQMVGGC